MHWLIETASRNFIRYVCWACRTLVADSYIQFSWALTQSCFGKILNMNQTIPFNKSFMYKNQFPEYHLKAISPFFSKVIGHIRIKNVFAKYFWWAPMKPCCKLISKSRSWIYLCSILGIQKSFPSGSFLYNTSNIILRGISLQFFREPIYMMPTSGIAQGGI